jgi:hypothetical protein
LLCALVLFELTLYSGGHAKVSIICPSASGDAEAQ